MITELCQLLLYFSILLIFTPSGCIDHAVKQSCGFSDEVNSKLICMIVQQHILLIDLQVPAMKSLTNSYRLSSDSQKTHSITNIQKARQTTTLEPMDHYSFIRRYVRRPTFVSLRFQLFCLEIVSDSLPQKTRYIHRQNRISKQTKKVTWPRSSVSS